MTQYADCHDTPVMRLAHPLRCAAEPTESFKLFMDFIGPDVCANMSKAFEDKRLTSEITSELVKDPANKRLTTILQMSNKMAGGTEVGNSYSALLYLRQAMHPQPYFVIDDALVEMLENTDIADDVPVSVLQLPFPRFFVEFGKSRQSSLRLPNIISGQHILEGSYLEQGHNTLLGEGIFVLLTGSPLGKSSAMDDATHSIFIPISDPNMSVKAALDITFKKGREMSQENGLQVTPVKFLDHALADVLFLIKVLLYIGLPEARKQLHQEKTEWSKATSALKSTAKKAKAERRGRGLVDHIFVRAPIAPTGIQSIATGRSVKSHWRRGHYRMQAHGVLNSLRKVLFIQPTLVHGDIGDGSAKVPHYKVG